MSRALIAGAVLGAGLVSGGILIQGGAWREARAATGSVRLLDEVMARVGRDYIDTVSIDAMYRYAASGFVKEIEDPYSALLTPEQYRRMRESATGKYAGVGIELDLRGGFVTVIAPLAGTPADSAGIKPGDRIVAIDGKTTHGLTMDEVQQAMRGAVGTRVRLSIERDDASPVFTLTRREIVLRPIKRATIVASAVGYVELATFSDRAADEVRRAIDSLRVQGATSLILDLRANPGGRLEQGIAVADLFLNPKQTIARTRGRTPDTVQDFDDVTPQRWPALPIVALVDSGTASAAEIVAGALQDHGRAAVIGSPTYGRGSAQSLFPVTGGRALKLTTSRWSTPKGRIIERDSTKGGIEPDIKVQGVESSTGVLDPVIARAIELLRGVRTPGELRARVPARP